MSSISSGSVASFDGGPLGSIDGVLDKFGLDFSDVIAEFNDTFYAFETDISSGTNALFDLRPINLPQFSSLLQIGSKHPSVQYSPELKGKLWDRLSTTFTSSTFNGVKIPNLDLGQTFSTAYPNRGDFSGECIL